MKNDLFGQIPRFTAKSACNLRLCWFDQWPKIVCWAQFSSASSYFSSRYDFDGHSMQQKGYIVLRSTLCLFQNAPTHRYSGLAYAIMHFYDDKLDKLNILYQWLAPKVPNFRYQTGVNINTRGHKRYFYGIVDSNAIRKSRQQQPNMTRRNAY